MATTSPKTKHQMKGKLAKKFAHLEIDPTKLKVGAAPPKKIQTSKKSKNKKKKESPNFTKSKSTPPTTKRNPKSWLKKQKSTNDKNKPKKPKRSAVSWIKNINKSKHDPSIDNRSARKASILALQNRGPLSKGTVPSYRIPFKFNKKKTVPTTTTTTTIINDKQPNIKTKNNCEEIINLSTDLWIKRNIITTRGRSLNADNKTQTFSRKASIMKLKQIATVSQRAAQFGGGKMKASDWINRKQTVKNKAVFHQKNSTQNELSKLFEEKSTDKTRKEQFEDNIKKIKTKQNSEWMDIMRKKTFNKVKLDEEKKQKAIYGFAEKLQKEKIKRETGYNINWLNDDDFEHGGWNAKIKYDKLSNKYILKQSLKNEENALENCVMFVEELKFLKYIKNDETLMQMMKSKENAINICKGKKEQYKQENKEKLIEFEAVRIGKGIRKKKTKKSKKNIMVDINKELDIEKQKQLVSNDAVVDKIENWNVGSKCEIYSKAAGKWVDGIITKIYEDDEGEWLTVQYLGDKAKDVQRYNEFIRIINEVKGEKDNGKSNVKVDECKQENNEKQKQLSSIKQTKSKKQTSKTKLSKDDSPIPVIVEEIENWKINSKCEIYSKAAGKWVEGIITKIYEDDEGEWLRVQYLGDQAKDVQRYSELIRILNKPNDEIDEKTEELKSEQATQNNQQSDALKLLNDFKMEITFEIPEINIKPIFVDNVIITPPIKKKKKYQKRKHINNESNEDEKKEVNVQESLIKEENKSHNSHSFTIKTSIKTSEGISQQQNEVISWDKWLKDNHQITESLICKLQTGGINSWDELHAIDENDINDVAKELTLTTIEKIKFKVILRKLPPLNDLPQNKHEEVPSISNQMEIKVEIPKINPILTDNVIVSIPNKKKKKKRVKKEKHEIQQLKQKTGKQNTKQPKQSLLNINLLMESQTSSAEMESDNEQQNISNNKSKSSIDVVDAVAVAIVDDNNDKNENNEDKLKSCIDVVAVVDDDNDKNEKKERDYDLFCMNNCELLFNLKRKNCHLIMQIISKALVIINSLRVIQLCSCGVDDYFMSQIVLQFMENVENLKINTLDLQSNNIGDNGMLCLCELIKVNCKYLTVIRLQNNQRDISTGVCKQICDALEINDYIVNFGFEFRSYGEKDRSYRALKKNMDNARIKRNKNK